MAGPWEAYRGTGASGAPREIRGPGYEAVQKKRDADRRDKEAAEDRAVADEKRKKNEEIFGVVPTGYRRTKNGELEPIPGGPAKVKVLNKKRLFALRSALTELDEVEKMARGRPFGFPFRDVRTVGRPAEIITSLPLVGGLLNQPRVNLESAILSVDSRLITDAVAELALANEGGVSRLADTPPEARRLASGYANLDPNQSLEQFLRQSGRARQYFATEEASELAKLSDKYPDKQPVAPSSQKVTVPLPDGRVASFPDQQSANAFKRKAGIR